MRAFNSRPHAEVDNARKAIFDAWNLSTHDLTQRSTFRPAVMPELMITFNSRPHAEVDLDTVGRNAFNDLSTHDLTQRSTKQVEGFVRIGYFQLTTSRRGRQHQDLPFPPHLTFQLTTSRRGRPAAGSMVSNMSSFQLTTSRRGRRCHRGQ